jgi:hypothetical protein
MERITIRDALLFFTESSWGESRFQLEQWKNNR